MHAVSHAWHGNVISQWPMYIFLHRLYSVHRLYTEKLTNTQKKFRRIATVSMSGWLQFSPSWNSPDVPMPVAGRGSGPLSARRRLFDMDSILAPDDSNERAPVCPLRTATVSDQERERGRLAGRHERSLWLTEKLSIAAEADDDCKRHVVEVRCLSLFYQSLSLHPTLHFKCAIMQVNILGTVHCKPACQHDDINKLVFFATFIWRAYSKFRENFILEDFAIRAPK
jgi:hypothetical protein